MRILFAAAEMAPLARVGGLAEATAGLVAALRRAGVDVDVVLPDYGDADLVDEVVGPLDVPPWAGPAHVRLGTHPVAGPVTLLGVAGIARPHPYVDERDEPWPDNDARFLAFASAVASLATRRDPDVVHLNDWHTAAATAFLGPDTPTLLTIHTLGYQGVTDGGWRARLPRGSGRFEWYGGTNPLLGGIALADEVVTVSPSYAEEILEHVHGMGMEAALAGRGRPPIGILNGIDTEIWDPATDPVLAATYDAADLSGRSVCRAALVAEAGWDPAAPEPLLGVVSRLVHQKGIDLLLDAAAYLDGLPARLAVLGSGERRLAEAVAALAAARPDRVRFFEGYDAPLAHRMFAGADAIVMPSRFEPCGLAQMQAMRYGSIPVVTAVGGLRDTVVDADRHRRAGTGFVATDVSVAGVVDALHRAVRALRHPTRRAAVQRRGMTADWSWDAPAGRQITVYEELLARRRRAVPVA